MFVNAQGSPALLAPADYWCPSHFTTEQKSLGNTWFWVCLKGEVSQAFQYCSRTIQGVPVLVWNFNGRLRAFKNVCVHRHSKIVPDGRGRGESVFCQYHGWEYNVEGKVRYVPDVKGFQKTPWPALFLEEYLVETLGDCVLISFNSGSSSLRTSLGEKLPQEIDSHFDGWKLFHQEDLEIKVNWKTIVENQIEGYHVPRVHPKIFKDYRDEKWHDHILEETYTRFFDALPLSTEIVGSLYGVLARLMVSEKNPKRFTHTHVFPNLLFYYGSLFSNALIIEPIGAEKTRLRSFCYCPSQLKWPWFTQPIRFGLQFSFKLAFKRIFREDLELFDEIQQGLRHASSRGVLSNREERVLAFQRYLQELMRRGHA